MLTDSFLFLHIPRTGGTSVERSLSLAVTGKWFPDLKHHPALMDAHLLPGPGREHQHWKLAQVIGSGRVLPDFRFAIVRNPWRLVVSEIAYFRSKGLLFVGMSWKEAIRKLVGGPPKTWGHDFQPQLTWLLNGKGEMDVDFVGRTECLIPHFNQICGRLGIQCEELTRELPAASRKDETLSEIYDEESRDWVARRFAVDCAVFGYEYPGTGSGCADTAPMERAELTERLDIWREKNGSRMDLPLPAKVWTPQGISGEGCSASADSGPGPVVYEGARIGMGTMILPRMESRHLRSWLEHHVHLGVEYFCILSDGESVLDKTFGTGNSTSEWGKKPSVDFELETPFEEIEQRIRDICDFIRWKYPWVTINYHRCDEASKRKNPDYGRRKRHVEKIFRREAPEIEWMGLIDVDEYVVGDLTWVLSTADEETAGFSLPHKVFEDRFQDGIPLEPRKLHHHYGVVMFNRKTFARLDRIKCFPGSHSAKALPGYQIRVPSADVLRFHHFRGNKSVEKFRSIAQMNSFTLLNKADDEDDAHDRNFELILGTAGGGTDVLGRLLSEAGIVDYAGATGLRLTDELAVVEAIRKIRLTLGGRNRGFPVCDEITDPELLTEYALLRATRIYLVLCPPAVVAAAMLRMGLDPMQDDFLGRTFSALARAVQVIPPERLLAIDYYDLASPNQMKRILGGFDGPSGRKAFSFGSPEEGAQTVGLPDHLNEFQSRETEMEEAVRLLGNRIETLTMQCALDAYHRLLECVATADLRQTLRGKRLMDLEPESRS